MQLILLVLIAEIARLADAAGASERWLVFNQNTTFYPYTVCWDASRRLGITR